MTKYKWKPTRQQRKIFAERMANDPEFAEAYYEKKHKLKQKRLLDSMFSYENAGGTYFPTIAQYNFAMEYMQNNVDMLPEEYEACNQVIFGYSCNEKIHHDHIHIVNELMRKQIK